MRKRALKKVRDRKATEVIRQTPGALKTVYDKNGNMVVLNTVKHAMEMKEYKNEEYNKEMLRDFVNRFKDLEGAKEEVPNA